MSLFDPIATKILGWVPVRASDWSSIQSHPCRTTNNSSRARSQHRLEISHLRQLSVGWAGAAFRPREQCPIGDAGSILAQPEFRAERYLHVPAEPAGDVRRVAKPPLEHLHRPDAVSRLAGSGRQRSEDGDRGSKTSLDLNVANYFSVSWDGFYTIPATVGDIGTHWTYIKGSHSFDFGGEV